MNRLLWHCKKGLSCFYVKKPMSPNKDEIVKMGAMAKKYNRILSVCHVLRYSPFFSKIKEIFRRGKNWKNDVNSAY